MSRDNKPSKPTVTERAIVEYGNFDEIRKCSTHDGFGENCEYWLEVRRSYEKKTKRIPISALQKCYDLHFSEYGPLGVVKKSISDKVVSYDRWLEKEEQDFKEYERLKDKFR